MAAFSSIIAVIGLGLTIVGTVVQQQAQKKSQKQAQRQFDESNRLQRQAEEKQQKIADLQTLRAKRAAAREAQIRRADVTSAATSRGAAAAGGTALPGARGSITSQISSNLSFLDRVNQLNTQTVALLGSAAEIGGQPIFTSSTGSTIAGFGGTLFAESDKIAKFFED